MRKLAHECQNHYPAGYMREPIYSASISPYRHSYTVMLTQPGLSQHYSGIVNRQSESRWIISHPIIGPLLPMRTILTMHGISISTMAMITGTISQITIMLGVCAVEYKSWAKK